MSAADSRDGREWVVRTEDGLELCVHEWGDLDGTVVIAHHGTPSCRLSHPGKVEDYLELGIRLVTFDRPGYGHSTPRPGRNVAAAADDARTIADSLGLDRFAIYGVSGGGPHAIACAALLPERVTRAVSASGFAPADDPGLDFTEGMAEPSVEEYHAAMQGREALAALVEPRVVEAGIGGIDDWFDYLPAPDQMILSRERREAQEDFEESRRQGAHGWLDDDLAHVSPWGFDLESIRVSVRLWQGDLDVLVPQAHGEYLASRIPGARFDLVLGAGHWLEDHRRSMLAWLVSEE